jgi:hypothetical protein
MVRTAAGKALGRQRRRVRPPSGPYDTDRYEVQQVIASIDQLLHLLDRLDKAHIHYTLMRSRHDAISVAVVVPGQRWEIDVLADGEVNVEVFRSDGAIYEEPKLEDLFRDFSD